jgi:hypothetical protein
LFFRYLLKRAHRANLLLVQELLALQVDLWLEIDAVGLLQDQRLSKVELIVILFKVSIELGLGLLVL